MHLKYEKPAFLPTLRELVRCTQAFERFSASHIRSLGLTPAQFDVIATLGNTDGMTCGELGDKTLITKGTLTGVLDRMEERGLIARRADRQDARRTHISLTQHGEALFVEAFPKHLDHLRRAFDQVSAAELRGMAEVLSRLHRAFDKENQR